MVYKITKNRGKKFELGFESNGGEKKNVLSGLHDYG
jgi:hypothetical protein